MTKTTTTTGTAVVEQIAPKEWHVFWHGYPWGGVFPSRERAEQCAAALDRDPEWSHRGWIAEHRAREAA